MKHRTLRRSPIMEQIFDLISEYYEYNAKSPTIIKVSPKCFRRMNEELGGNVSRLVSFLGDHLVHVDGELREDWIEVTR